MAGACRAPTHEEGIVFNQAQMEDVSALYEALINYLADSAFPVTTPCQGSPPREKGKGKEPPERPFAPSTYDEMLQLAMQRESAIKPARKRRQNGSPPAPETILSIVNTLRSFALSFNLGPYIARSQRTLDLLLRLCDFPLLSGGAVLDTNRRPLRSAIELSWLDLLTIRKDMLVIIAQLGLQIEVDKLPRRTTKQLFDLICFFLSQPSDIDLPASYGGSHSGRSAIRRGSYGTYTEAALTALSQVATRDSNRETFGSLASPTQVFNLFDALFQCLPLTDDDFSGLLEHPIESIHRLERLALCLYNIAFLAPTEVKNRIRQRPGFGRVIYGVMNKISSANNVSQSPTRELGVFCRRLLEMMDILSKSPDAADSYYDPLAPFFGGAFAGGLSGERRERESQSERRLQGEVVEAPRAEDLPSITCYSAGIIEMLASPGHDPVVYNLLAKLL